MVVGVVQVVLLRPARLEAEVLDYLALVKMLQELQEVQQAQMVG